MSRGLRMSEKGALAALIWSSRPGPYKAGGSPDQRVVSLREEVLANLACKLYHLVEHVRSWQLSSSCGHIVAGCGVVAL
jgi:hypothetical protein